MLHIPAGEFWMGCNEKIDSSCDADEKPGRKVYLDAYLIDKTEVTVEQYARCVRAGRCKQPRTGMHFNWGKSSRERHPVNGVDWNDAEAYCAWAGKRLPTEAEWEKAARGTDGRLYPWGNEKPSCAYAVMREGGLGCGRESTWPVCSKERGNSPYGLCDMAGNVREWVADKYKEDYYSSAPSRNPEGAAGGSRRVYRGGCWVFILASNFRASLRFGFSPGSRFFFLGFRCARSATP
ncbi:MAG: SUMF1/EgtB/PvdO family nonheme iron enzyme [Deltaproteobacteria bacterium]|nr:SUMF1/EgtB/PvdO family nonheme iron enzyme [Deltaproteobacteria bacterium]